MELVTRATTRAPRCAACSTRGESRQVGEIRRRDHSWDFDPGCATSSGARSGRASWLHRNAAGEADGGYARYRAEERWEQRQPRNTLQVDELHGLTTEAARRCGGSSPRSTGSPP